MECVTPQLIEEIIGSFARRCELASMVGISATEQLEKGMKREDLEKTHWYDWETDWWIPHGVSLNQVEQ